MVFRIHYVNSDPVVMDLSKNLPITSAGSDCIEIDNGQTRGIYLYTTYGIFYTNDSLLSQGFNCWQLLGTNLPHVASGSLEINYNSQKLRAGLYGRGVWEFPLPCITDQDNITVNTDQIWTNDTRIGGIVRVKSNVELTIKDAIIAFGDNARIVVEQGGKLIIDGSTLTNACATPWQGIQVWGDKNQSQKTLADGSCAQGKLILKNGATIENAIVAIDLWKPDDWSTTGGMVYATDAVFRNNAKAVHALHYRNFNPQYPQIEWKYFSNFKNCTFEITEDYVGAETFHKHVDLSHVKGINFQACDFSVAKNAENVSTYSSAIMAYNAKFAVNATCGSAQEPCPESSYDRSSFTGFYTAIKAFNDNRMPVTFSVNKADFINNAYGVKTQGMHNASVLSSHFEIGELWGCGAGIYADFQSGFAFEENDFSKFDGASDANYFGILINQSEAVNEVYKNSFNGLTYANFADGKNWTEEAYKGLAYYCNNNSNNYADFFMNNQSIIQSKQGGKNYAAGNTFSQNGATWHFYNGGSTLIDYYYNQNASDEIPDDDKIYHINKIGINNTNTCPSHYGNDISTRQLVLTPQQKMVAEETYINNLTDYNALKALYDSYVDGGNTESEKMAIQTAQPNDMWALRAQLLGDSPHLSLEVLKEAADKTEVFTEAALFDILAANPDELKKDTLIKYLENKETPLPAYMIDLLKQVATGTTYKTALQQQMANYQHAYTRAAYDIIRSNLNDTVSNYVELRNWLDNLGGIVADRQIISSYICEHNFTDAMALANMLPQLYNLTGRDLTEHNYYIDMLTLYKALAQEGRNTYQLNSTEKANLISIANHSQGVAGAQARGILEAVYNIGYSECPEVNETNDNYAPHSAISSNVLNQAYGVNISVKPNPAKEWAAFEYTLPSKTTAAIISITDASGSEVATLNISGIQGQKLWDTRHVKSGVYIYTLKVAGFTQSGKIVITK